MEFEGSRRLSMQLNIAPLIDVVFLLLIFFMLTSTMLQPHSVDIDLPASSSSEAAPQKQVAINVQRSGKVSINGQVIQLGSLGGVLRSLLEKHKDRRVLLRADAAVPLQELLKVMDQVRLAGGVSISLGVMPDSNSRGTTR